MLGWKGEDTQNRVEASQMEKCDKFLKMDVPVLHFAQREHRDSLKGTGWNMNIWGLFPVGKIIQIYSLIW